MKARMVLTLLLVLFLGMLGCMPAPEKEVGFSEEDAELLLMCVLDISGSFEKEMLGTTAGYEGSGFKTFLKVRDQFFRNRQQSKDRFVIAHISGSKKALLYDAIPQSFQQRFPNAKAFRDFINASPDPGGSRVYDSLRDCLDYTMLQHRNSPKLKSMVLIWSDMDDNVPDHGPAKSKQMLIESLREYAGLGGVIGIYGCEIATVPEWMRILRDAGFKNFIVEANIRDNPKLPLLD